MTETIEVTLARIDERIKATNSDIALIQKDIAEIRQCLKDEYVTLDKFTPVQKLVYGVVGVVGGAILVALFQVILA